MAAIKAIETIYNGYRFRSRLEARWAVWFDAVRIPYEYEIEGFDLGAAGWYLPDFWLPSIKAWVEIKPLNISREEIDRAYEQCGVLGDSDGCNAAMVIAGSPWKYCVMTFPCVRDFSKRDWCPHLVFALRASDARRELWLWEYDDDIDTPIDLYPLQNTIPEYKDDPPHIWHPILEQAEIEAKQARFEHGERGRSDGLV